MLFRSQKGDYHQSLIFMSLVFHACSLDSGGIVVAVSEWLRALGHLQVVEMDNALHIGMEGEEAT